MNTLIAVNPSRPQISRDRFAARIELRGRSQAASGENISVPITVTNTGRSFWPAGADGSFPHGVVTLGPYVPLPDGGRLELPRQPLPRSLSSGESFDLDVSISRTSVEGGNEVHIDLVREGIAWFADYGSAPLVLSFEQP
jgi:hypothetical protein